MNEQQAPPVIVDPQGQPARQASKACPGCGAPPEKRGPSSGFGQASTVCLKCGHDFEEVWRG